MTFSPKKIKKLKKIYQKTKDRHSKKESGLYAGKIILKSI